MYFQDIVGEKMRVEKQLIKKMYYETFLMENETKPPIDVLGEVYVNEERNEISDGSYIRFAQGEFYYHHQDFEAAIFKWEKVSNELAPWAQKILPMLISSLINYQFLKMFILPLLLII